MCSHEYSSDGTDKQGLLAGRPDKIWRKLCKAMTAEAKNAKLPHCARMLIAAVMCKSRAASQLRNPWNAAGALDSITILKVDQRQVRVVRRDVATLQLRCFALPCLGELGGILVVLTL